MDIFDLTAKISLNSNDYINGLNYAEGAGSSFGQKAGKVFGALAKAGAVALTATTTAVVAFGKASVETGKQFDSAMSQVMATMGFTVDELNTVGSMAYKTQRTLRSFAQEMGRTTAFSATQCADALNYMALAGYDAETSMKMLPQVLNLASAGSIELATASDMVTDAQTALGLSLEETETLINQMAKTASTTNTSVSQMGEAILTVGGTATYMSRAVDQTSEMNTVLGVLANNGIKGSEAGTHLRNMLLSLSSPTDDATELLKSLNVNIFDSEGKLRSFSEIFPELNKAMESFSDQKKLDAFSTLFNSRDIASATGLYKVTTEEWATMSDKIRDCANSAEDMAKVQLDNLAGDITLFQSALEGAKITVSNGLSPALRDFVQLGTQGLTDITTAYDHFGIDVASKIFGNYLADGINMISEKLPAMVDIGMEVLTRLIEGITRNMPKIADSAVSIVTTFINGLIKNVPTLAKGALQLVSSLVQGIITALPQITSSAIEMIKSLTDGLKENLPTLIEQGLDMIQEFASTLAENVGLLVDAGMELLIGVAQGVIEALPALIEKIPVIITTFANIINDNMPKILETGIQIIIMLVQGLIQSIPVILQNMPQIIEAIISVIEAVNWLDLGKNIIEGIGNGITSMLSFAESSIGSINEGIINILKQMPSKIASVAKTFIRDGLIGGMKSMFNNLIDYVLNLMLVVIQKFASFSLKDVGANLVAGLWEGIQNMAGWIYDKIASFGAGLLNALKGALDIHSPSKATTKMGVFLAQGLGIGWEDAYNDVKKTITKDLDFSAQPIKLPSTIGAETQGTVYNQTINVNQQISTADELAREIRLESKYGLMRGVALG